MFLIATGSARAANPSPDETLNAHLRRGEFRSAIEMVPSAESVQQREAWLGQIATELFEVGAGDAARLVARGMSDESDRSRLLASDRGAGVVGRGGGTAADFDELIELIQTTIEPDSWEDVGGTGTIQEFPTGVLVDARGVLSCLDDGPTKRRDEVVTDDSNRAPATRRAVSLSRLEDQLVRCCSNGESRPDEIANLAGLYSVEYIVAHPESGELLLVGPADTWESDRDGRIVSSTTGRAVFQLDDLLLLLRHSLVFGGDYFGCAITPRQESLARTQQFLNVSAQTPIQRGARRSWLETVRQHVGLQDISVFGIDPRTRVARVLVEADYHMKRIGIGLEPGVDGVPSYLDLVAASGGPPPTLDVLRWWFTMSPDSIEADEHRTCFRLVGPFVRLQSENELLTELGARVHTGQAEPLNREFARNFTERYDALALAYPVYADLQNVFQLALVAAIIAEGDLTTSTAWHPDHLLDAAISPIALGFAPQVVETIINHRVVSRRQFIAMASGGVRARPRSWVRDQWSSAVVRGELADFSQAVVAQAPENRDRWWWDVALDVEP